MNAEVIMIIDDQINVVSLTVLTYEEKTNKFNQDFEKSIHDVLRDFYRNTLKTKLPDHVITMISNSIYTCWENNGYIMGYSLSESYELHIDHSTVVNK